jgi:hypothetical protein
MDIKDLIVEFENFIPQNKCSLILSWFNENIHLSNDGMVQGGLSSFVKDDFKKAKQIYPDPQNPVSHLITDIIFNAYKKYSNIRPTPESNICARDYSIRVYPKNEGYFKSHVDQTAGGNVSRVLAIIMYLNDVEIGGETEFITHNIKITPRQGKVLIFPCTYLFPHQGNMPISDDKYIATAFINYIDLNTQKQS